MLRQENDRILEEEKEVISASPSENIKFRWSQEIPQYGNKLLQRLDEFRRKNMYYDIIMKTNNAPFSAHKIVMAACGGVFRRLNSDPKIITNDRNITELSLNCSGLGLRTIIKFAYSGVLQINQTNLLATCNAAAATDMNEIQDICSAIAITKFGWMLRFDGTEETLPKNASKSEKDLTLRSAFTTIHQLLLASSNEVNIVTNSSLSNLENFQNNFSEQLCLEQVEAWWPNLKSAYVTIMNWLQEIKNSHCAQISISDGNEPAGKRAVAFNHKTKDEPQPHETIEIPDDESSETISTISSQSNGTSPKKSSQLNGTSPKTSSQSNGTSPKTENKAPVSGSDANKLTAEDVKELTPITLRLHKSLGQLTTDEKEHKHHEDPGSGLAATKSAPFPSSKPPISVAVPVNNSRPPIVSKNLFPNSPPPFKATTTFPSSRPSVSVTASVSPPRQKHGTSNPPLPTHKPIVPSKPPRNASAPSKPVHLPKQPAGKVPPPRPKPPVFHQKNMKNEAEVQNYDDSLNPFA